jgi:hypothetical protein
MRNTKYFGALARSVALIAAFLLSPSQQGVAATILPAQPGATNYNLTSGPVGCGANLSCTTTLVPPGVVSHPAGPVPAGLQASLNAQFPGFTYVNGGSLNITYNITTYSAFNDGTNGGATFTMDITNPNAVVLPANLHWVQWVTDNYNFTQRNGANLNAATGLGNPEDTIDGAYPSAAGPGNIPPAFAGSPFYDVFGPTDTPFATSPPHFTDTPQRPEPTLAIPVINWNAWLFLVSSPATLGDTNTPVQITFYDGVEWGWQTTIVATPLPAAGPMMLAGLGLLGSFMRRRTATLAAAA